jgi:hypothetical protein
MLPPDPERRAMCEQCEILQKQIDQYNRFLLHRFDPLTEERLKAALLDLERRKSGSIKLRPQSTVPGYRPAKSRMTFLRWLPCVSQKVGVPFSELDA